MLYYRVFIFTIISILCNNVQADQEEIICLAKNIYYEARNKTLEDKLAVAFVTYDRAKDKKQFKKSNTICEVVWQPGQFSWTFDGKPDNPYETEIYNNILELSEEFYEDPYKFENPVNGALFYHADYVTPCWLPDATLVKDLGTHKFYNVDPKGTSCWRNKK